MEVKSGYKQTEVGIIPEDWETKPLGKLTEFVTSGSRGWAQFYSETGALFIRSQNIRDGRLTFEDVQFVSPPPGAEGNRTRVELNDLLITITGNSVGNVALVEQQFDETYISQHVGLVRLKEPTIGPYVCRYLSPSSPGNPQIAGSQSGQSKPGLNLQNLRDFWIALPPTPNESNVIAKALGDVDGLLGGLDQLITKKRNLKRAAMQQLLTGQTRLPGFHGEWKEAQVQNVIADFFCGPSPTCEERNIEDDEWGVLKTTAATKENGWDWTKHKTLPRMFWNKPQIELKKGDVIVTKAGPRHRVGVTAWIDYVPPRIIPSGKMIALRPNADKVVPLMLAAAITARDAQTYLDQRTTGMAESQVNFENVALLEAPIKLPRIEEQAAITEVLTEMAAELAALEQRQEKIRALKQAMMQELLTGRTRLVSPQEAHA